MELIKLIDDIMECKNPEQAAGMKAYMRDQFEFLGVPTPKRKECCRPYFKEAKKANKIDWDFVDACWEKPYREMQYIAVDYLNLIKNLLGPKDIPHIKKLAVTKSWWDTIDALDQLMGAILLSYPESDELMIKWSCDKNFWLRRIAIDHQLNRKEKTNPDLLGKIIINNFGSDEFFINKAIGWSLREYSKTNPKWVSDFIKKYKDKMAPLSIREASKYI